MLNPSLSTLFFFERTRARTYLFLYPTQAGQDNFVITSLSTFVCRSRLRPFSWTISDESPSFSSSVRQYRPSILDPGCPPTMDHITSRFRRNKKEAPATPQDQSPASTPTSTTADGNVLSPENRNALPSLTITTSPVVTTPPGSSHGSHGLLPKSPLRGFSHFRTAHKRARSPAPVQTKASNSSDNAQADSPTDQLLTWPRKVSRKPQLPFFLNLSDSGTCLYQVENVDWLRMLYSLCIMLTQLFLSCRHRLQVPRVDLA
jgi:hypothetical protein